MGEVAALFLRLGATAFGGPAAYIAMMRDEVVTRRGWIDDRRFLDLLGTTNLIPGPNAVEMSMHLGWVRAGWAGLLAGGVTFMLPAVLISLGLAWVYGAYGTTPAVEWLLYGIKPAIIPLIVAAIWKLSQHAVKGLLTGLIGLAALALYVMSVNFVLLLVGGGVTVMLVQNVARWRRGVDTRVAGLLPLPALGPGLIAAGSGVSLGALWLVFARIGLLMYGSGYVLFAYFQAELVEGRGWLTEAQLVDAIAIGQMTPGPLSNSATVIGYVLAGVPGALVATLGINLPALVLVALSGPLVPRLRESRWVSGFLDGVNVVALALMAAVTWELGRAAFVDGYAVLIGAVTAYSLLRYRLGSGWLVVIGAALGWIGALVG